MSDTRMRTYVHRLTNTMAKAFQLNHISIDRSTLDQCPVLALVYLRHGKVVGTVIQNVNGVERRFQVQAGEWLICNLPAHADPRSASHTVTTSEENLPAIWYTLTDESFKKHFVEFTAFTVTS